MNAVRMSWSLADSLLAAGPCVWCSRPCTGTDESGDPSCDSCRSEGAAVQARETKRSREIRASIAEDIAAITQSLAHH